MNLHPLAIALLVLSASPALAATNSRMAKVDPAAQAVPAANENRIVRFTYSPEVIYRILTTTAKHTHIELGEDEGLKENPVMGDSVQWRVSGGPRNIYVKPVREDIDTSLTIVTNKRSYQFQLISGNKTSSVYQKVSFDYPDREAEIKLQRDTVTAAVNEESGRLNSQILASNADPTSYNFGYDIVGEASFKPLTVYSDDKFTYLRMPNTQVAPAVFLLDQQNTPSLVNYKPKGNFIVVERLASGLLLKLGNEEVRVFRRDEKRSALWNQGVRP